MMQYHFTPCRDNTTHHDFKHITPPPAPNAKGKLTRTVQKRGFTEGRRVFGWRRAAATELSL